MALVYYLIGCLVIPITYLVFTIIPKILRIYRAKQALKKLIPGPEDHWLFGELHKFPGIHEDGLMYHLEQVDKFPRYRLSYSGPLRTSIHVHHPETIKQITNSNHAPKVKDYAGIYRMLLPWIGDGLLLSDGPKWYRNRKLLTPGFHFDVLKPYVAINNDRVEWLMTVFEKESADTGESIDIFPHVCQCTLDIIFRCAFSSTQASDQTTESKAYVKAVVSNGENVLNRLLNPLLYYDALFYRTSGGKVFTKNCELSHNVATEIIERRMKEHKDQDTFETILAKGRYVDFLDILLLAKDENGTGFTFKEIRDEVETFMFAGHDTTASGISWILHNLARHPDIQEAARAEVDELLDGRESDQLEWGDMQKLPYLTRCIKESLRLHPPVPFTGRQLAEDITIDGMVIPKGTGIDIGIWSMHRNPTVWKDPATYDPDRFLPESMKQVDSHAFMPFSAGPRNCIGQHFAMNEIKTTVARMLRKFVLKIDDSKPTKMSQSLILRTEHGMYLFFEKRP